MNCGNCGSVLSGGSRFCSKCGAQVAMMASSPILSQTKIQQSAPAIVTNQMAPQLHFEAGLQVPNSSVVKKVGTRRSAPLALCVVILILSIAVPVACGRLTVIGLQAFFKGQVDQIGEVAAGHLQNFSFSYEGVQSASDKIALLIKAARQAGGSALWLFAGLIISTVSWPFFAISTIGCHRTGLCRAMLLFGGCMMGLGGGLSVYGFYNFLNIVPLAVPYAYTAYLMLGGTILVFILIIFGLVSLSKPRNIGVFE